MEDVLQAIGLLLAIEGGLYALFPRFMKKMAMTMLSYPAEHLRTAGLAAAVLGVALIWLVRRLLA